MAMEETFQFIIESPQISTQTKKRPRLVTSCDNCRLKKIKCTQSNQELSCDACRAAKLNCQFKDRAKYFQERSRAIQNPQSVSPPSERRRESVHDIQIHGPNTSPILSHAESRQASRSPKTTGLVSPDTDHNRYQPYASASESRRNGRHAGSSSLSTYHSRSHSHGASILHYDYPSQPVSGQQLFDPDQPIQVHPNLMHQFITLFFDQYGTDYPFLSRDAVYRSFVSKRLSPLLASCIAAMACRHHSNSDLASAATEVAYSGQAKQIFTSQPPPARQNLPTVQALVLLGWYDYHRNQYEGFRVYTQHALHLGAELRLPEYKFCPAPRGRAQSFSSHMGPYYAYAADISIYCTISSTWSACSTLLGFLPCPSPFRLQLPRNRQFCLTYIILPSSCLSSNLHLYYCYRFVTLSYTEHT
ncbi:hypothetical protein DL96DRAFT_1128731 [Flagelloscypha sp. PMI_526]|nr:hypothetical protein DL96DRAFT_1128731 [Flagelloscypha sp. PMI_526]